MHYFLESSGWVLKFFILVLQLIAIVTLGLVGLTLVGAFLGVVLGTAVAAAWADTVIREQWHFK